MKKLLYFIPLLLLLVALPADAALSFVTANQAQGNPVSSVEVPITTTNGDLIVVVEGNGTAGISDNTPTDSAGNSYSLAASSTPAGTTAHSNIYYAANANAIATSTCIFSSTVNTAAICIVYDITGAATSNVLDATSTGGTSTSVTSSTSGAYTTTNANDILIFGTRIGTAETTYLPAAGFTIPANATNTRAASAYDIVSAIQTNATTSIGYNSSNPNTNVFASFKAAASSPAPTSTTFTIASGHVKVTAGSFTIQ